MCVWGGVCHAGLPGPCSCPEWSLQPLSCSGVWREPASSSSPSLCFMGSCWLLRTREGPHKDTHLPGSCRRRLLPPQLKLTSLPAGRVQSGTVALCLNSLLLGAGRSWAAAFAHTARKGLPTGCMEGWEPQKISPRGSTGGGGMGHRMKQNPYGRSRWVPHFDLVRGDRVTHSHRHTSWARRSGASSGSGLQVGDGELLGFLLKGGSFLCVCVCVHAWKSWLGLGDPAGGLDPSGEVASMPAPAVFPWGSPCPALATAGPAWWPRSAWATQPGLPGSPLIPQASESSAPGDNGCSGR